MSTFTDYAVISANKPARIDDILREGQTAREIAYFRENIGKVSTGDDLIDDYRLYRFAMTAFGLESQIYARGLMRKVFDEGIVDQQATANRLTDDRFRQIAEAFGFAETGNLNMLLLDNVDAVVDRYLQQALEVKAGESNEGVRLALYFDRQISSANSWYDIIGDTALYETVRVMLGLPDEFVSTNIDRQVEYFEDRLPLADLKDPQKREKWMQRFTTMWDATRAASGAGVDLAANGIVPIQPLGSGAAIVDIDPALLAELSAYRL